MCRRVVLVLLGLILAGASGAWAQPRHHHHFDEAFHQRLLELKRHQLGPALGADQETVNKLLAIDQRYRPLRHQLIMAMKADFRRLQQLVTLPNPPERDIKVLLANMNRNRLAMHNLQQRKDKEEAALLTPVQQARYIVYLMGLIREARNVRTGPPGGPRGRWSGHQNFPGQLHGVNTFK
jgi:Spy/CpxP family protein refolding chaperone